jgi:biotin transport system ATP-binding protein
MSIIFQNVYFNINEKQILKNININLSEPRIAIIGNNGSGKSTFLRLINGLFLPTDGHVIVDDILTSQDIKNIRGKVGMIFQNPEHQIIMPTVEEDLAIGLKQFNLTKNDIKDRVENALNNFGLNHLRYSNTYNLSGGEKQLLAIAGVLIINPLYLLFDESTTLLDYKNKKLFMNILNTLKQTIIFVTHDLELIRDFNRAIVMNDGKISYDGKVELAIKKYLDDIR